MSVQELLGFVHTANPPVLVTQGDADTINPPSYGYTTFADASPPKFMLVLHGGGHLAPLLAGSRWLPTIESATEDFFHLELFGGTDRQLLRDANQPPLASMQT
jgi:hypothetical protein